MARVGRKWSASMYGGSPGRGAKSSCPKANNRQLQAASEPWWSWCWQSFWSTSETLSFLQEDPKRFHGATLRRTCKAERPRSCFGHCQMLFGRPQVHEVLEVLSSICWEGRTQRLGAAIGGADGSDGSDGSGDEEEEIGGYDGVDGLGTLRVDPNGSKWRKLRKEADDEYVIYIYINIL